jgi:hypothetical protein
MPINNEEQRIEKALLSWSIAIQRSPKNDIDPSSQIARMSEPPADFKAIADVTFDHPYGGRRAWLMFPNGYGASIINTEFSYGDEKHPWEVAVMTVDGFCASTPITDDVIGHCDEADVVRICKDIFNLPPKE